LKLAAHLDRRTPRQRQRFEIPGILIHALELHPLIGERFLDLGLLRHRSFEAVLGVGERGSLFGYRALVMVLALANQSCELFQLRKCLPQLGSHAVHKLLFLCASLLELHPLGERSFEFDALTVQEPPRLFFLEKQRELVFFRQRLPQRGQLGGMTGHESLAFGFTVGDECRHLLFELPDKQRFFDRSVSKWRRSWPMPGCLVLLLMVAGESLGELFLQAVEFLHHGPFPQCRFEPAGDGNVSCRQDHRWDAVRMIEQGNGL
jgi:hypothetical protein